MKDTNIIDFASYLHEHHPDISLNHADSLELIDAIDMLIQRLREHNPLKYPTTSVINHVD